MSLIACAQEALQQEEGGGAVTEVAAPAPVRIAAPPPSLTPQVAVENGRIVISQQSLTVQAQPEAEAHTSGDPR